MARATYLHQFAEIELGSLEDLDLPNINILKGVDA